MDNILTQICTELVENLLLELSEGETFILGQRSERLLSVAKEGIRQLLGGSCRTDGSYSPAGEEGPEDRRFNRSPEESTAFCGNIRRNSHLPEDLFPDKGRDLSLSDRSSDRCGTDGESHQGTVRKASWKQRLRFHADGTGYGKLLLNASDR